MTFFLFKPDKKVEVVTSIMNQIMNHSRQIDAMSFLYNPKSDVWMVLDPKSGNWITYMAEGVPEIYRAQVLLLVAAYPD